MNTFLIACRPKTLIASISPVCIGGALAYAHHSFHLWIFLLTLMTGLGIQISTNLANDLFDFLKGADNENRKGPTRVTASGLMSIAQVKMTTFLVMSITAVFGSALALQGGLLVGALLPCALLLALGYTAGPFPLSYLGIAEFFILVFFGPVATGMTYFLQTQTLSPHAFLIGLAPGLLSCSILIINNLRDVEEDRAANKKTLVARLGTRFGKWEFALSILMASALPLFTYGKHPLVLGAALTAIPGFFLVRSVFSSTDPHGYKPLFGQTGKLLTIYTIMYSLGLIV
ncbi:MAG: 1,4-dihydroxy-2-naphthoate octaprenyltransferase [Simkaniaceae bacterium]|nr:1,4-dihydroxy-2-naphthoate octaprenyltransferase [Candidatus Sacchlamyda saccharinae]